MPVGRRPRSRSPRFCAGSDVRRRIASASGDDLLVTHIVAEEAGEIAVGARVRARLQENALRRGCFGVRAEAHPRDGRLPPDIVFAHQEIEGTGTALVGEHEVDHEPARA